MKSKISKIGYHLPNKIVQNIDLANDFPDWDYETFEKKIGIKSRRVANDGETALDLGFEAANKLINYEDRETIDFVLLCTQSPDYFLPSGACILQDKLNLCKKNIGALDINLGCSGFVYGLALAKGLIACNSATKVLFITAETYNKHINPLDKTNKAIFGDGAAACIIEKNYESGIGEFILGTDGSGYDKLITLNGGFRNPKQKNPEIKSYGSGNKYTDNDIYMNGPDVFNFTIETVPPLISETLVKNNLTIEQIDHFVFHQANAYMLNFLRKKCKIPKDRFYIDFSEIGNTVSSTIPIALSNLLESETIKKGEKVMLVGFGVGLSWGATIIEF